MAAPYVQQQPYNTLPPQGGGPLENGFAAMSLAHHSEGSHISQSRPRSAGGTINWVIMPDELTSWDETPLGGATGSTYRAKINGHAIALKRLPADTKRQPLTDYIQRCLPLKHENIIQIWGASPEEVNPPYLVTPYLENGNAKDFLNRFPQVSRIDFVKGIALGMAYLHSLNIIHGRLKTSNILVNERGQACIIDHGLYQIGTMPTSSSVYFSPEAWKGKVSKASDVFAFSMVTYELLSNSPPWGILAETQIYQLVAREGERPDRPDEDALPIADREWALLGECWKADPASRPSFAQIVEIMQSGTIIPPTGTPVSAGVPSSAASSNEAPRSNSLDTAEPLGPPPPSYDAVLGAPGIAVIGSSPTDAQPPAAAVDILGRPLPPVSQAPVAPAIDSFRPIPSYGPNQYPPEKVGLHSPNNPQQQQQRADHRTSWMSQPSASGSLSPYSPALPFAGSSSQPGSSSSSSNYGPEAPRQFAVANPGPPGSPMTPPPTHFSNQYAQYPPMQQQFTGVSQSPYPGSPPPSGSPRQQSFYPSAVVPLQSAVQSPGVQGGYRPGFDEQTTFPPARHMSPVQEGYLHHEPQRQFSTSPGPIEYHPGYDLNRPGTAASSSSFSNYVPGMAPLNRPAATSTGKPSAVIVAGALQSEVSGERNRERIDALLVDIQRLASDNAKEVEKFITAGVVTTLITILKARAVEGYDLALVLKTLGILAHDSVSANTVFRTKTADVLCEIIESSSNQEAVLLSIWCISRISRNAELASSLVKKNVVSMLVQKGFKASPQTASITAWAIGNLVYTDALAETVSQVAAQPSVDNLALSIRSGPEDMCAAIYPIARMARSIKLAKLLAKCGCIGPLVHCLTTSENPDVLMWSARAIGCLMRPNSADMSRLLLDAGAAQGLARLPKVLPSEVIDPLESFAFTISRFSCAEWGSGTRKALVEAGVVDSLLAALRTAADVPYPKVHIELALAVSFLGDVGGGDLRKEIVRAGGIDILKRVGANGNKEVSKACSMAVTSITGNLWSRNAASAKTAMSHDWSGGCPDHQPPSPI